MRRVSRRVRPLAVMALTCGIGMRPATATAQAPVEDVAAGARFHWGPVFLTPALVVKEIGIDSNVFNDPEAPREDFTATLSPQLLVGLRAGSLRVSVATTTDYVWYRQLVEERSTNTGTEARVDVLLGRVRPFVRGRFVDTRERPGFEIDRRARRTEPAYGGGIDLGLGSRTRLVAAGEVQGLAFAAGESFRGVNLDEALNRESRVVAAALRVTLTPFTTVAISGSRETARFDTATFRDADSVRLLGSVEFQPDAVINGSAQFGLRRFRPRATEVPAFDGIVATVNLGYTLLGMTRFGVTVQRDLAYSIEDDTPYYVLTGAGGSLTQRIGGPFDVTAGITRRWLAYRGHERAGSRDGGIAEAPRRDVIDVATAGLGVQLGSVTRLGVTVEFAERRSNSPRGRPFERTKLFASLTYQFTTP